MVNCLRQVVVKLVEVFTSSLQLVLPVRDILYLYELVGNVVGSHPVQQKLVMLLVLLLLLSILFLAFLVFELANVVPESI